MQKVTRKIKAYSIVEMLVTMAIFGIIISMLMQSLFLNIKLTTQINLRTKFNTDLDQLVSIIERDIRNADYYFPSDDGTWIKGCTYLDDATARDCTMSSNDIKIKWYYELLPTGLGVVKRDKQNGATITNDYITTPMLDITSFEFFINSTEDIGTVASLANILVTIKVKPAYGIWGGPTDTMDMFEQVRQISVSTRNYEVKF
jgi:prepilin-type N-terminal cleavage/methylation domain-containing protein